MKATLLIFAVALVGCGESKEERADKAKEAAEAEVATMDGGKAAAVSCLPRW